MALNIDYTTIDFDALKSELISYLKETGSFKDIDYVSSNINTLVQLFAYMGSLFGYYINSIANEPFLPSAKRYKNLNRIAKILNYNPRGDKASQVDAVGSINPEYCLGKEGVYFQIPAYSKFPSITPTPDGTSFNFTNEDQLVYMVRAFGIRTVQQQDFTYDGNSLPLTMPATYWNSVTGVTGNPSFLPSKIQLTLSDTKPLSILNRLDTTNYRRYDTLTAPLYDPSDSNAVGQPFNRNISTNGNSLRIIPGNIYYVVFNYDTQTSTPYLTLMEEGVRLDERKDDIITSIRLDSQDANGEFYTLREVFNNSKNRFYVGVLGMLNLESLSFSYDKLENTEHGIKQVHLDINKSGNQPPFQVLVDGVTYTFKQGTISSQIFDNNSWDTTQPYYNINLNIVSPDSPDFNYDATLTVTSSDPGINEVTIAQIYTNYIDSSSGIKAIDKLPGQRFGNIQALPAIDVTTTEQRTGFVNFTKGVNKILITFDTPFTASATGTAIDYIIELTPNNNVQLWYSDKSENGFSINVEQDAEFEGRVNWVATRFNDTLIKSVPVVFSESIPQINAGFDTEYTVFLTASDNVKVWYENKTSTGFNIVTEKDFNGTISYSTFVESDNEKVIAEKDQSTQKKGRITLTADSRTKDITFDNAFSDDTYGLHTVSNLNFNTWYTNKTATGFTINVEPGFTGQITIDWFADASPAYVYQKHGMISFSGQLSNGVLPGIRFKNIAETFQIFGLKQGDIAFTYLNKNGTIDPSNNSLNLDFSADRSSANIIKLQAKSTSISYTDIRIFVKNQNGDWEEWIDATSETSSVEINVGSKIFFVRVNEDRVVEITFGDGETYGTDPYGNEIIIFGLNTVGKNGNIPPNTLNSGVVLSQNILGDDNITINFEQQFIQLVGLKTSFVQASGATTNPISLYDSEGTELTETELTIKQPSPAFGGQFVESVEELRSNASTANLRQDRIVSLEDYRSFCNQYFSDYITKVQVLSYKELKDSGFLPPQDLDKYFFNYIFIIALPTNGNVLQKTQRDYILGTLDKKFKAMATVEHELFTAAYVNIDVRVRIKTSNNTNISTIQSLINQGIQSYFTSSERNMGETIQLSQLQKIVLDIPGVLGGDVAINRNDNNSLTASDYDNSAVTTAQETVEEVKRRKILEILAKDPSLLKIIDPLFNVTDSSTGKKQWLLTGNLVLNTYEFPKLGNIIIEVEG